MDEQERTSKRKAAGRASPRDPAEIQKILETGEIEMQSLVPWSSNYTYLARVCAGERELLAIYKPSCGERPLWDFETGTLCNREVAAYLVSAALGWPHIPITVLREGPRGLGAVQQFIEFKRRENFFTLRDYCRDEMQRIAVFDALINNTDRKGGHILMDQAGVVWCIDHGVTFHEEPKLRTVVWDFVGDPIPDYLLSDLQTLRGQLHTAQPLRARLDELLSRREIRALEKRLGDLLRSGIYPDPPEDWPHIPWPPI